MTKYLKVVTVICIPDDVLTDGGGDPEMVAAEICHGMQDWVDNAGCYLLESSVHAMSMVESSWLDAVTQADEEDDEEDDLFSWATPTPVVNRFIPPLISKAEAPQNIPLLNMGGIDPESPEGQDIIQQFVEATTPDLDADDAT